MVGMHGMACSWGGGEGGVVRPSSLAAYGETLTGDQRYRVWVLLYWVASKRWDWAGNEVNNGSNMKH